MNGEFMNSILRMARKISRELKPFSFQPLVFVELTREWEPEMPKPKDGHFSTWENNIYEVTARHYLTGSPLDGGEFFRLGIASFDGSARHDWRAFQAIKKQLCGEEWEALELYPAESRLLDPSNYYILYVFPSLPFGKRIGRSVVGPENCQAPQRGWANGSTPKELQKITPTSP